MARRPTRADESRAANERYVIDEYRTGLPHVPSDEIPPNMCYRWVAEFVRGAMDEGNVRNKTASGWRAVPASRHPSIASGSLFPGARPTVDDATIIRFNGLVLCEKEKRLVERERNAMLQENLEILQSTPGLENLPGGYVKANNQDISRAGFQGD
jgi:hypothetical protein